MGSAWWVVGSAWRRAGVGIGEACGGNTRKACGGEAGKGVRGLAGYFMVYYTIWLAPVKSYFVPFWDWETRRGESRAESKQSSKPTAPKAEDCGTRPQHAASALDKSSGVSIILCYYLHTLNLGLTAYQF